MTSIVDWQLLVVILGAIHARLLEDELTIHHIFSKAFKTVGNNELGMLTNKSSVYGFLIRLHFVLVYKEPVLFFVRFWLLSDLKIMYMSFVDLTEHQ